MKDYITKVKEMQPFLVALLDDYNSADPSGYVYIAEDGKPKLKFTKAELIPTDGIATVAICRLTDTEKNFFEGVSDQSLVLGEAVDQYIKSIDDVKWIPGGKDAYHQVHKQDPIEVDSDNGAVIYTPPPLHCSIAS